MRSDAEILAWIAPLFNSGVDASTDPILVDRYERIEGALSVGLKGRECLEAAMGAVLMEVGDPLPLRSGVQQIADHLEAHPDREELLLRDRVEWDGEVTDVEALLVQGACMAARIDRLQRDKIMLEVHEKRSAEENAGIDTLSHDGSCSVCGGYSCSHLNGVGSFPS